MEKRHRKVGRGGEMQVKTQQSRSLRVGAWWPQGGEIIEFRVRTNFETRAVRRTLIALRCLSNPKCL
jgi:hypothetical protein